MTLRAVDEDLEGWFSVMSCVTTGCFSVSKLCERVWGMMKEDGDGIY